MGCYLGAASASVREFERPVPQDCLVSMDIHFLLHIFPMTLSAFQSFFPFRHCFGGSADVLSIALLTTRLRGCVLVLQCVARLLEGCRSRVRFRCSWVGSVDKIVPRDGIKVVR